MEKTYKQNKITKQQQNMNIMADNKFTWKPRNTQAHVTGE